MDIHRSAHKHGVEDGDVTHAVVNHLYAAQIDDQRPWRVLYLGPDRAGNLLEVVVVERDDGSELAIHAMKMRKSYRTLLTGRGAPNDG